MMLSMMLSVMMMSTIMLSIMILSVMRCYQWWDVINNNVINDFINNSHNNNSFNDCWERCDKNILNCFSGNRDCFNKDIAKNDDDVIYKCVRGTFKQITGKLFSVFVYVSKYSSCE